MKILKYLLYAVVAVAVLIVIAVAAVVATFDPNKYKGELAKVVKEKTGRTLTVEGKIGLSLFPSLGVDVGKTSLSERGSDKTFAKIDEVKVSLAVMPLLSRQVVIDKVTLSGLNVDLVQDRSGKTNFADLAGAGASSPPPKAPQAKTAPQAEPVQLDIAGIEVRASSASWHDEATGGRYKATIDKLETGRIASGVPGKLSLAMRLEASQPKADYQVNLSGQYRLNLEKQSFAFSGMDLKVADATPGSSKPPLSLKGEVEVDTSPQAIRFALAADKVNLDRYLPPPAKAPAGAGAPPPPAKPEEPIDLSGLKGLNLKGDLKIEQLIASNVKLENVHLGVKAAGGKVDAEPLTADLYQGKLNGAASVNANDNRFALKADLPGVAIGPLLKDALNNDMLEGKGNVALDVQTAGNTVTAMKKALAGTAKLSLKDGALKGVNLDDLMRKLKNQPSPASSQQRTDLSALTASFVIKNGVAHNDDLVATAPLLRLTGSGDADIGGNALNYVAKVSGASGGLGLAMKIDGPLDAPKFHPDFGALARDVAKEQAGKAQDKLKERAKDYLKGLLRR
ncbi:MAG TPA: AsmA family protein [Burkholderiales bacterium]|nr:AsmA family protein [Burkholderiales bacterium]